VVSPKAGLSVLVTAIKILEAAVTWIQSRNIVYLSY
jgi:hypothetical protein